MRSANIDVNTADSLFNEPLIIHAAQSQWSVRVFKYLLDNGADHNVVNRFGDSLNKVCEDFSHHHNMSFMLNKKRLKDEVIGINYRDNRGNSLIDQAVANKDINFIRHLQLKGADLTREQINIINNY